MSDTPRTDAKITRLLDNNIGPDALEAFSKELERELNAANERIKRLQDYIASLETAGDMMAEELSYGYDVDKWKQSKEGKP